MIDNHTLEVISTDFVPIVPYNTTAVSIGMGQRYDVIVEAKDLSEGNFWLRSIPQETCSEFSDGQLYLPPTSESGTLVHGMSN